MESIHLSLPDGIDDYMYLTDEKIIAKKYSNIIGDLLATELDNIKEILNTKGVVKILIEKSEYSEDILKGFLLGICNYLGIPTYTDQVQKKMLWNITPKENINRFTTFSEVDGEALLHTDSQFSPQPEHYFLLYCSIPANIGGISYLVEIKDILEEIKKEINGNDILKFLNEVKVPFRVPSIFTKTGDDSSIEIYKSTILSKDNKEIRFRFDTVEEALKIAPNLLTDKEIRLFRYFQEMLEHRVKKVNIKLKSGECLIIDNKKLLHGRTAFEDPNRLLYRIRFNNNIGKTKLC